jgi:hypothetical protein
MAAATDNLQPTDHIATSANTDTHAASTAGAAMSSADSLKSLSAMKVPDSTYGNLPDFHITPDENPYGVLSKAQNEQVFKATMAGMTAGEGHEAEEAKALHIPANSNETQIDAALGKLISAELPAFRASEQAKVTAHGLEQKGGTKVFADMTSDDPNVAKAAAKEYFSQVYGHATPQQLSDFRDEIDNSMHNSDVAREDLGITHKASEPFMEDLKDIFDSKAPGLTKAEREDNPSVGNRVKTAVHNLTGWTG